MLLLALGIGLVVVGCLIKAPIGWAFVIVGGIVAGLGDVTLIGPASGP